MASHDTEQSATDKAEQHTQKEILRKLAELGGGMHKDDAIAFGGDKIQIPKTMTIRRAIKFMTQVEREMETETTFTRTFNYRPWDGAYCMWNVFKRTFGAVSHTGTMGFFGPNPPQMLTIPSGPNSQTQVPWGQFGLPILEGASFETDQMGHPELGPLFQLSCYSPKKWADQIEGIFNLVEEELKTNSMYRGKAFDGQTMPEFIDLSGVDPSQVVYSKEVMTQLEVNVWAQLRHTDEFVREGIPLKRAVLVHGPYGTGKTLAAILTGQEATANGWTFIKGRPGRDHLGYVMQTARLYQPAVVFYEDVDQIADGEVTDTQGISQLLDVFDGIEAKDTRILCVLTSNHADRIHKGMARPGRLDAMIEIDELDLAGVTTLVKVRLGERLAADIDWAAVFAAAEGYKPAFVTEFSDRAIRYALDRVLRDGGNASQVQLTTDDLVESARGLRPQYELMVGAKDRHEKPVLDDALGTLVTKVVRDNLNERVLVEANDN